MIITGRIIKALPKQSGTSQRTGNPWESQEFVIEYFENPTDRFPDRLVFRVMGADRLKEWNIQEGDENVTVGVSHRTNEYNGRFYNELSAYSFSRNGMQQPNRGANQPAGAAQQSTAGNYPNQQAIAPQNAQNVQAAQPTQQPLFGQQQSQNPQNPSNDDLPF